MRHDLLELIVVFSGHDPGRRRRYEVEGIQRCDLIHVYVLLDFQVGAHWRGARVAAFCSSLLASIVMKDGLSKRQRWAKPSPWLSRKAVPRSVEKNLSKF